MATNLWVPFSVQLDASGNGTQEVGAPAVGYNWQGYITFGQAPSGQSFTVSVSGQVVAYGNRQSGPFAAGSGQTVTVTVTGGPASSTVSGVVQGVINSGVAAQAALPASGSLVEVSGGTVNINGGKITIEAGQNGVNVSTDSPPVVGPQFAFAAVGDVTLTDQPTVPSNATGWSVSIEAGIISGNTSATSYTVQVTDRTTGVVLAEAIDVAAGDGVFLTGPTNAVMVGNADNITLGITLTGGSVTAVTELGYWGWYIGGTITGVNNSPAQPLFIEGPQVANAQPGTTSEVMPPPDVLISGPHAYVGRNPNKPVADVITQGPAALAATAPEAAPSFDQVVQGYQGQSGASVQTVPEAPANYVAGSIASLAAGGSETIIAAVAGKTIRLRDVYVWGIPASGNAVFEISSTVSSINNLLCGPPPAFFHMDFKGATTVFPADTPFVFANSGSETTSYTYLVLYDLD